MEDQHEQDASAAIPNSNGINKNRMVFAFRGL
jgi:hypothetical protein